MPPGVVDVDRLRRLLPRHYALEGRIEMPSLQLAHTAEVVLPDGERLSMKDSSRHEAASSA
ncbi:hypothetical protein ACQR1Y_09840 [Bradyrhizobium sp. HKCCYLRH3099]|uniref:hypothetical protein n=1 Tax=unclassified Bradyrhizobium TaxID=2631580 RepID=UPI003EBC0BFA